MTAPSALPLDGPSFRTVCGHFATGITIITANDGDEPVGMAANSFSSVSLEPPLVLFCADKGSTTWPRIQSAGSFAVNILASNQEEVCRAFATRGADRFRGLGWRPGAHSGSPVLHEALAFLDCSIEAEHDAGDHVIVVGRVREMGIVEEHAPLLFYRGGYGRFEV